MCVCTRGLPLCYVAQVGVSPPPAKLPAASTRVRRASVTGAAVANDATTLESTAAQRDVAMLDAGGQPLNAAVRRAARRVSVLVRQANRVLRTLWSEMSRGL